MHSTGYFILILAVLFFSAMIRSALGFGDALIAMPLLALFVNIRLATPLVAFMASTIAVTILFTEWRTVNFKAVWKLIVSTVAGIPLGLIFLKHVPESLVKGILGVMLVGFGLYCLILPRLPVLRDDRSAYAVGFVAGILGGAYNTNGPPVVIYGALRRWPPEQFRSTLQCYFLPTGLVVLLGHGASGFWTSQVLCLYACAFPLILLAIFLGGKLNRRIPRDRFNRLVYGFLVVVGLLLFVR